MIIVAPNQNRSIIDEWIEIIPTDKAT